MKLQVILLQKMDYTTLLESKKCETMIIDDRTLLDRAEKK